MKSDDTPPTDIRPRAPRNREVRTHQNFSKEPIDGYSHRTFWATVPTVVTARLGSLRLPEQQVNDPAAAAVPPLGPAVSEGFGVIAPGVL
ncbi:hypothetical protein [Gemmata obscuriglobus]|uniref:hypothetical protein n=1 Tax=Gemmata obscuriglobus TaxID=114 RepID=UPI0011CD9131|nr:hypothetical protein [Gemmata obscuriglobus]